MFLSEKLGRPFTKPIYEKLSLGKSRLIFLRYVSRVFVLAQVIMNLTNERNNNPSTHAKSYVLTYCTYSNSLVMNILPNFKFNL